MIDQIARPTAEDSPFKKFDTDKLRWDKFCWSAAEAALYIMHFGAKKYDWDNWRKARGENNDRMLAACMRHLIKHLQGEKIDPESGYPHLWHSYCALGMHIDNARAEQEASPPVAPGSILFWGSKEPYVP